MLEDLKDLQLKVMDGMQSIPRLFNFKSSGVPSIPPVLGTRLDAKFISHHIDTACAEVRPRSGTNNHHGTYVPSRSRSLCLGTLIHTISPSHGTGLAKPRWSWALVIVRY